jgi:hypothetical protein
MDYRVIAWLFGYLFLFFIDEFPSEPDFRPHVVRKILEQLIDIETEYPRGSIEPFPYIIL